MISVNKMFIVFRTNYSLTLENLAGMVTLTGELLACLEPSDPSVSEMLTELSFNFTLGSTTSVVFFGTGWWSRETWFEACLKHDFVTRFKTIQSFSKTIFSHFSSKREIARTVWAETCECPLRILCLSPICLFYEEGQKPLEERPEQT